MKISCPACSAKYSIADDKVQDRLAKIRCRKCGATIVIDGKSQPPNVYTSSGDVTEGAAESSESTGSESAGASEATGTEYSVDFGEGDQRTLPLREVVAAYNAGQITGETYVWADGFPDWKALSEVPEITSALNTGASAATAPVTAAGSPWDAKPQAAKVSTIPRAAARTSGTPRAANTDLFGRIDQAGSEEDVSTSAPEPSPLATPSATGAGARNESSVLFSLSALTAQAQPRAAASRPSSNGSANRDDSGLIDLKALTAAAMKSDQTGAAPAVANAVPLVAPVAPLGVAPPLGLASPLGISATPDMMPHPKSKAPLFIGGGLALGLIAIAAAIVLTRQPPPPPQIIVAAPTAAAPAAPAPSPEPIAAQPPPSTPEEPATTQDTKPKPRAVAPAPRRTSGSNTSSGSSTTSKDTDSAKPAAPAPKRNACGCAPGDLQCAMKCAAKGG